ncbi:MAG: hypothetical protein H8E86_01535 [Planctomycetes bacterium]|nr:hypothetical protein [Planctomycetota bacterium]
MINKSEIKRTCAYRPEHALFVQICGTMVITMKVALFFLLITAPILAQDAPIQRVPLLREGTKIYEATGGLTRESPNRPLSITIEQEAGGISNKLIVLPNERLAEMEAVTQENTKSQFRFSGEVFAYGSNNYLLVRSVVSIGDHASRIHPTIVPIDPNAQELNEEDFEDSVEDIFRELEEATGSLVSSIRNAAENPINSNERFVEGALIVARRCHLVRNKSGAWIAVFVSDSSGLSDPPCTILPSMRFKNLTQWFGGQDPSTPVLLTGELLQYHGHAFLSLQGWRPVHKTDHLP